MRPSLSPALQKEVLSASLVLLEAILFYMVLVLTFLLFLTKLPRTTLRPRLRPWGLSGLARQKS